jgi:DNA-binding MarR family transcriptional regulator
MKKDNSHNFQNYELILENCTCMHIRKSSRAVTQYYDTVLAPAGVSSTQLTLLVTIFLSKSRSLKEIADKIGMKPSSLTRMLRPMFEQDLVENEAGNDKKAKQLTLTEKGERTLRMAAPLWENAQKELVLKIGEGDWQDLIDKLAIVAQVPTVIID